LQVHQNRCEELFQLRQMHRLRLWLLLRLPNLFQQAMRRQP
jgi:hypothetical protein